MLSQRPAMLCCNDVVVEENEQEAGRCWRDTKDDPSRKVVASTARLKIDSTQQLGRPPLAHFAGSKHVKVGVWKLPTQQDCMQRRTIVDLTRHRISDVDNSGIYACYLTCNSSFVGIIGTDHDRLCLQKLASNTTCASRCSWKDEMFNDQSED